MEKSWNWPPTWGICRTDFRRVIKVGDYIFFVLPKASDCIIFPVSLSLHCWVLRADRALLTILRFGRTLRLYAATVESHEWNSSKRWPSPVTFTSTLRRRGR